MTAGFGASELRRAVLASLDALRVRRDEIDRANVYPVPDGDTGTNMALTMEAAGDALDGAPEDLGAVSAAIVRGSLLGARGNSGVILAQWLRGLCETLEAGGGIPAALEAAAHLAREAVLEPVEGTILTVAAGAAGAAAAAQDAAAPALGAAADGAARALARTPDLLPALRDAGVVDAGGWGLVVVLEAFRDSLSDRRRRRGTRTARTAPAAPEPATAADGGPAFGWEVQYLLEASAAAGAAIRSELGAIGESVAVIGGEGLWRVHVHTHDPDRAIAAGRAAGRTSGLSVVPLRDELGCEAGGRAAAAGPDGRAGGIPVAAPSHRSALVAVASGDGARALFRELGAAVVVDGGRTMNPSVREFLDAIEAAPAPYVIVLTNNDDAVPAAGGAAGQSDKGVEVVGSPDMAAGVAAALAFGDARTHEQNVADMRAAIQGARSGSVAAAWRSTTTAAGPVRVGQFIGFARGELVAISDDAAEAAVAVAAALAGPGVETVTVVAGAGAPADERARLAAQIRARLPGAEVELRDGGQPVHRYLLLAE